KAINICKNKEVTKKYLLKGGVNTPKGNVFDKEIRNEEIVSYANKLGYPVVLKPSNASGGRGVIANIANETEFIEALEYVRDALGFSKVIVEQYIEGQDYRLYVIGNEVVGAFYRIPANIVGDGKNTIRSLFEMKRKERMKNPGIYKQNI